MEKYQALRAEQNYLIKNLILAFLVGTVMYSILFLSTMFKSSLSLPERYSYEFNTFLYSLNYSYSIVYKYVFSIILASILIFCILYFSIVIMLKIIFRKEISENIKLAYKLLRTKVRLKYKLKSEEEIDLFLDRPNYFNVDLNLHSRSIEGKDLATFLITMPKSLVPHITKHRVLSTSSASSRALNPDGKVRKQVLKNPVRFVSIGKEQRGMVAERKFTGFRKWLAIKTLTIPRYFVAFFHWLGELQGIHKENLNRILEPWMTSDLVVTATEWDNFFSLRTAENAQPDTRLAALWARALLLKSQPQILEDGSYHLPRLTKKEYDLPLDEQIKISAARCAGISYKIGKRRRDRELGLYTKLKRKRHSVPFEHVATPTSKDERSGNFIGWIQHRKELGI